MKQLFRTTILFYFLSVFVAKANSYPEVIFDNSLVSGVYAKSLISYTGQSWVENVNKHLLVSDTLFFTPGNALSLRYKSAATGTWEADLQYSRQKMNYRVHESDVLVLKLYIKSSHTNKNDLPTLTFKQQGNKTSLVKLGDYVDDLVYQQWISIKIPVSKFAGLIFDTPISALSFTQAETSNRLHELFLDQVEFQPKKTSLVKLSSPAILSKATAFDKQVQLHWQLPLTPSIRYVKIYRSEDKLNFVPVGIRPISMQSCLDFVPDSNRTYFYKISWVDFNYVESPFSETKEVKTKPLSTEGMLDLVQSAHINYFVENYDINSGMYIPFRLKDKALVSVKESGHAVLSLIVGVDRGFINRQLVMGRISKIVFFLLKAQNRYGIFPEYFDGRSGLPDYRGEQPNYDVLATSSMLEALLVARQYFANPDEQETDLRNRITQLWESVQWDKLCEGNHTDVLLAKVSGLTDSVAEGSLGGINSGMNAYMLAMSSTKHPLPLSAYENGVKSVSLASAYKFTLPDTLTMVSPFGTSFTINSKDLSLTVSESFSSASVRQSIMGDTSIFGENLKFGVHNASLTELYRPFFTLNPHTMQDGDLNFAAAITSYIKVRKRRDNEIGVGSTSSDIWGFYQLNDSVGTYWINPAIATSSMFLAKVSGIRSMKALYEHYGDTFFTEYGFRAWLDLRNADVSDEFFALNQATIAIMIENSRSGLIWNLYGAIPEIQAIQKQLFTKKE